MLTMDELRVRQEEAYDEAGLNKQEGDPGGYWWNMGEAHAYGVLMALLATRGAQVSEVHDLLDEVERAYHETRDDDAHKMDCGGQAWVYAWALGVLE